MKKFLFTSAIILSPFVQAKADFIMIDGVVDETPNRSYRAAGGGVTVHFNENNDWMESCIVADKSKYSKAEFDFGENTKILWSDELLSFSNQRLERASTYITLHRETTEFKLFAECTPYTLISLKTPIAEELIKRDSDKPLYYRFRIAVTEYTPGEEGQPGTAKVELRQLGVEFLK